MALRNLFFVLGAKTDGFTKELSKAERNLDRFSSRVEKIGSRFTTTLTAPLLAVGAAAGKMAMDVVESENLFEVSMGKMAKSAREWSEGLRNQLGLNAYEVRRNVGTFNVMLSSMGLAESAAFSVSKGLTQLSYDMASFYNLHPEEAFEKLQSGISGEVEPLRRLGIVVDENTIKQVALTEGIIKQGEEMSQGEKVVARYLAIMEQTGKAQGDLARTMESPTNQMRILWEQAKNLATDFGMSLLPTIQAGLAVLRDWATRVGEVVQAFDKLSPSTKTTIIDVALLAAAIGPALIVIGKMAEGLSAVVGVLKLLGAGKLFGLVIEGFSRLAFAMTAWLGGAASFSEAVVYIFGSSATAMLGTIGLLITAGFLWVKNWDKIKLALVDIWRNIANFFGDMVDKVFALAEKLPGAAGKWAKTQRYQLKEYFRQVNESLFTKELHMVINMKEPETKTLTDKVAKMQKDALASIQKSYKGLNIPDLLKGLPDATTASSTTKSVKTATDVMADLQSELDQITVKESLLGDGFDDSAAMVQAYTKAFEDLVSLGLKPTDANLQRVTAGIKALGAQEPIPGLAADKSFALADVAYSDMMPPELTADYDAATEMVRKMLEELRAPALAKDRSFALADVAYSDMMPPELAADYAAASKLVNEGLAEMAARAQEAAIAADKSFGLADVAYSDQMTPELAENAAQAAQMGLEMAQELSDAFIAKVREIGRTPEALSDWAMAQDNMVTSTTPEGAAAANQALREINTPWLADLDTMKSSFSTAAQAATSFGQKLINAPLPTLYNGIKSLGGFIWNTLMKSQAFSQALSALSEAVAPVVEVLAKILAPIFKFVGNVFMTVAKIVAGIWNAFASAVNSVLGWLGVHLDKIRLDFDEAGDAAKDAAEQMRNVPAGFKAALQRFNVAVPVPAMATGGYVPATTGGTIVRLGEGGEGEFVVPESKTGGGGSPSIQFNNCTFYGVGDFKRAVREAVAEATRKSNLSSYGLAGA